MLANVVTVSCQICVSFVEPLAKLYSYLLKANICFNTKTYVAFAHHDLEAAFEVSVLYL